MSLVLTRRLLSIMTLYLHNKIQQDALFYSQFISIINLYMFRTVLLLIIKRYLSVYTAIGMCHAFMLVGCRQPIKTNSATCWFLLRKYITMHGPQNIKLWRYVCNCLRIILHANNDFLAILFQSIYRLFSDAVFLFNSFVNSMI